MRRLALTALLLLPLVLAVRPAGAEETRVTLLHTTDVHGSLLPWDDLLGKPAARGLAKAATLVAKVRAEGPPVLLLDDGDATAGSPLVSVWHQEPAGAPEPVTLAMNAMGYDAMALGNHEFDFGPAALESTRTAAKFPILAANVTRADGSPAFPGTLVKLLPNGVRVGIIGLCTPAVPLLADPAQIAGYMFLSPIEVAQREVARLRGAEHCDVIVVLAHTGFEKDPRTGELRKGDAPGEDFGWRLANEVRGVDVVILGHTHVVVPYAEIGGALVTQAGKSAESLGRVDLTLTRASDAAPWTVATKRATVIALGDTVATDPALAAALAPYAARTKAALDVTVATAGSDLAAPAGRLADNALWQLIHRAQLAATGADVSLAAMFDPSQVIAAGPVRVRDLMRLYPYDNTLVTVRLTGAELKEALEQSARFLAPYTGEDGKSLIEPGMPGFNFDMAMGVTYKIDPTKPVGQRILALKRYDRTGPPYWYEVLPSDTFRVVVNGYRAAGGGDFEMIRRAPRVGHASVTAPQALLAYARSQKQLQGTVQFTWSLRPDWIASPERPLIERLVRNHVIDPMFFDEEGWDKAANRRDLGYWNYMAFPHSKLSPLARRDDAVLVTVGEALAACERTARAEKLAITTRSGADPAFRRSLLTGTSVGADPSARLTRAQWLGMLANLRLPVIRVLETTDFHGAILGGAKDRRSGRAFGSTPALAAWIEHFRAENPEGTVLIDGGDIFQGTMISNLQYGRPVVEQMNLLHYTAAAIGNHDFDWTVDTLQARVHGMRFAALGANIVERKSGKRPWWVRSDTSVARRGVKVSILGLGYPGTPRVTLPTNVAHLRFEDDSATTALAVPRLRKAGANVVVVVGHIPAETDSSRRARGDVARLANGIAGVDAWFGGHSHNVVDDRIHDAPVMIAGANGQWLAMADLTVDVTKRAVVERKQRIMQVWADEYPLDTTWVARVRGWNANVAPIAAEVIGRNAEPLRRGRPEATIGDFICDAMRFQSGADIAMQNPGGMRADLPAGEITRGAIYEIMPFDNTIVVVTLTGAEVKRGLEQALKYERVTQVSGIRYAFDSSRAPMDRVTSLTMADGSPIDPAKTYKVAVNNFMATGGDNYDVLNKGAGGRDDAGLIIRGAMEAYVRDRCKGGAALTIREDGRITQSGR